MNTNQIRGKTKVITTETVGLVTSKDALTAGDGARREILPGKAAIATDITCRIFELLRQFSIPMAYIGPGPTDTSFYTNLCQMIPVEVVIRRIATGSYLKRHPDTPDGTEFEKLVVEFFYKTTDRRLGELSLPCDDPLMIQHDDQSWHLYRPNTPRLQGYICPLQTSDHLWTLRECATLASHVFTRIESAWYDVGGTLLDLKVEFGINNGSVILADVIDCDSWRVLWHGLGLSKQGFRDGDDPKTVLRVYEMAQTLVKQMRP